MITPGKHIYLFSAFKKAAPQLHENNNHIGVRPVRSNGTTWTSLPENVWKQRLKKDEVYLRAKKGHEEICFNGSNMWILNALAMLMIL